MARRAPAPAMAASVADVPPEDLPVHTREPAASPTPTPDPRDRRHDGPGQELTADDSGRGAGAQAQRPHDAAPPSGLPPAAARPGGAGWRLVLALWLLYVGFSWPGHLLGPLGGRHIALAEAFSQGRLRVETPEELALSGDFVFPQGREGGGVSIFAPGTSALLAPWCAAVRWLAPLPDAPPGDPSREARRALQLLLESAVFVALLAALPTAFVAGVLAELLRVLEAPRPERAALAFGVCSIAFPLAGVVTAHPASIACAAWALLQLARPACTPVTAALAGAAAGGTVLCDFGSVLSQAAPLGALAALRLRGGPRMAFFAGAAPMALAFFAWNAANYGGPFTTSPPAPANPDLQHGYTIGVSVFGLPEPRFALELLLGPFRGLLSHVPWVVLALLGLPSLHRRHPAVARHAAAVVVLSYGMSVAIPHGWLSGPTPGPRYQLPSLVVLVAPLAFGWARWPRLAAASAAAAAAVAFALAQSPLYASFVTAGADVVIHGPRLRILHSIAWSFDPTRDHQTLVLLLSPVVALPLLLLVTRLLTPFEPGLARARPWLGPAWLLLSLPALLGVASRATPPALRAWETQLLHAWDTDPLRGFQLIGEQLRLQRWDDAARMIRRAIERGDEPAVELAALTIRCAEGMAAAGDRAGAQRLVDDVHATLAARGGR